VTDDPITIGTRLWSFDENRRRYAPDGTGVIYEEHFAAATVLGETKGTWIVGQEGSSPFTHSTVNKKTLREPAKGGFSGRQWFTDTGKDSDIWAHSKRRQIVEAVRGCDVPTLKKIAAILEETAP